jgi:hypothetical protein
MPAVWKFRLIALFLLVFVGAIAAANLAAEIMRSPKPSLAPRSGNPPGRDELAAAKFAAAVAPFRSDLKGNYALLLAGNTLRSRPERQSEQDRDAQEAIREALTIGPHDSRMWLVLGALQARQSPIDPSIAESLKMSYLTGPNQSELISIRLEVVTSGNSLTDTDLSELARGDVRALLTQLPKQELLDDYQRASETGKKFLEESVRAADPGFAFPPRNTK